MFKPRVCRICVATVFERVTVLHALQWTTSQNNSNWIARSFTGE
ncbi:hypothetical protein HMPREF9607_00098 [Cutibacterium modestum HL044PA1]|uniref:Uncharacterized protein n=1 Tax=Cutibacterium modestum HL044PA1 TaxID=765109 RepID=A0ABP2K9N7_9ACTN|nr:hypothetical protein HMPREF9607_00098 [Cutibacterium modestum HL044PA1]